MFNTRGLVPALIFLLCMPFARLSAAWLTNMPTTVLQPNGKEVECFASGDEFHNWLHDKDGFTIIRDPESGELRYAEQDGAGVKAGNLVVGYDDPRSRGLSPNINISNELYKQRRASMFENSDQRNAPTTGQFNNLVVFIRFSDEAEYGEGISTYNGWFNSNTSSLKNYFSEVSYNQLTVDTHFFPAPVSGYVVSWQANQPRSYYQPYNATTNPNGYVDYADRRNREFTLLANASTAISPLVPQNLNIDADGDGKVDNVVFIAKGSSGDWNDLLWPHRWTLYDRYAYIRGKRVYDFNFQLQTYLVSQNVGVLCHEFYHSLGAPDLYHYTSNDISPAGTWDLMNSNTNPPQHMTTYMKMKYGGWVSSIPTISADGEYSLNPVTSPSGQAYRINSNVAGQHYIMEFRKKTGTFESSIPGSGIIVYRIDTSVSGNADGPPDELYVYRPGGTLTENGNPNNANFSAETGRTIFNNLTNPNPFLQNGSAGNLKLFNIGSAAGTTITFNKGEPEPLIWDFSPGQYQESFESASFPEGWTNTAMAGSYVFELFQSGSNPTCNPPHGSRMLGYRSYNASNGNSAHLVSPILRVDAADYYTYDLKLNMYRDDGYSTRNDLIEVWLARDPQLTQNPVLLGTLNRLRTMVPVLGSNSWHEYQLDLPIDAPGDYYLVLKAISAYGNNMYVDNLRLSRRIQLPLAQSFDDVTVPQIPLPFLASVNSTSSSAYVKTVSNNFYNAPNALALYNADHVNAELMLIYPALSQPLNTIKTRFKAKSSTNGQPLLLGTLSPTGVFSAYQTINLTNLHTEYEISLFNYSGTDQQIALKHGGGGTYRSIYVDDLAIEEISVRDLNMLACIQPAYTTVGETVEFNLSFSNSGLTNMQGYTLKIVDADSGTILSSATISTPLQAGATLSYQLSHTFSQDGTYQIYAEISHTMDLIPENNRSPIKAIAVLPTVAQTLSVGESYSSILSYNLPFNFFYKNSVTETIYHPAEGLMPGSTIHAIAFSYNFVSSLNRTPLKVWMKNTDSQDISSDWLGGEDYLLVFDGMVDIPAGEGSLFLPLNQPFVLGNNQLAIRSNRPMDNAYYSSGDNFELYENQAFPGRSRRLQSDSISLDPLAITSTGTLSNQAPKVEFYLSPSITPFANLSVRGIRSPLRTVVNETIYLELDVANTGNIDAESITVNVIDSTDQSLLDSQQISSMIPYGSQGTLLIPLSIPLPGMYSLRVQAFMEDEGTMADNLSQPFSILVMEESVDIAEIGLEHPGLTSNQIPFNFYYKNSLAETIYFADELSIPYTQITGIEYYYSFVDALNARPIKIWMKNTTDEALHTSFPDFEGYTLVFDSTVDFLAGEHTLFLSFDTPFIYTGANLAIRTNRVMDTVYYSSNDHFKLFDSSISRSLHTQSDATVYDPTASSISGITSTNAPKITFHHQELILESPELQISQTADGFRLTWAPVPYASKYRVYCSDDMLHWTMLETIETWLPINDAPKAFFKVVADTDQIAQPRQSNTFQR